MPSRRLSAPLRPAALALAGLAALAACAPGTETRYRWAMEAYRDQGLMRADADPADAPFGDAELIRNFERIAFHKEFADGGDLREEATPVTLVKWTSPVRWTLAGDAVRPSDELAYARLIARIERLTGLDFVRAEDDPDIFILIATAPGRDTFMAALDRLGARDRMRLISEWARNDSFPCVGQVGRSRLEGGGWTNKATIVIKDEARGLLRDSCIHEELVQTLGLLNDDAAVRPSIFNDDQEFALLTRHDEYLLRILYDPRLEYGMTAREGMPLVRRIVAEIGPGAP